VYVSERTSIRFGERSERENARQTHTASATRLDTQLSQLAVKTEH
jgi:hypothetical protein